MELFIVIPFHKRSEEKTVICIVKEDIKESTRFLKEKKPVFIRICFIIAGFNLFCHLWYPLVFRLLLWKGCLWQTSFLALHRGSCAILLFSYPIDRKIVVWVKTGLLLAFITAALQILLEGKRMDREFCACSLCQMFFCPGSFQGVFEKLGILDW